MQPRQSAFAPRTPLFASSPSAATPPANAAPAHAFLAQHWRALVVVLVIVLVIIGLVVWYNYAPANGTGAKVTKSKIVLPRSSNVTIDAAKHTNHKFYTPESKPFVLPKRIKSQPRQPNRISPSDKEVFNVSNNIYTYEDAPAVCKAFDARLATAKEVEAAYASGADWCNYGWTQGQYALYPTQQHTYNRMQKIKGHRNDCGIVGVNGGYFENPDLQFGVNCYGKKPQPRPDEKALIGFFPDFLSATDKRLQQRARQIKQNINQVQIAPFNSKQWDEEETMMEVVDKWMKEV